jgi:small subunit ribosomal protein S7
MPRRREVPRRETLADSLYSSTLITKFINCMMFKGKRSVSEGIFYGALDAIKERAKDDPVKVFKKAMDAVKPVLEVKSRRVGGATYQVPVEVPQDRRMSLAIRWIISNARARSEKTMTEKLAAEIMDASNNRGGAIKKKEDTHRMAEANKAFAHYRW